MDLLLRSSDTFPYGPGLVEKNSNMGLSHEYKDANSEINDVARTLKKLHMSKGDYWAKQ